MKKIAAIFICLILCAVLPAGCNSPQGQEAYTLYQKMTRAMEDVKSLDMDISMVMDISVQGSTINMTTGGNLKERINSETDIDMEMDLTTSIMGTSTAVKAYYTGGVYYADISGVKAKMPMSMEEAMQQAGNTDLLEFPESAIKDCKVTDVSGGQKIEFALDGKIVLSLTEQVMEVMKSIYPDITAGDLNMDISDITCEAVADSEGMMKSYRMVFDVKMSVEGQEMGMKTDISMTVNSYENVTIDFPSDLDSYGDM